MNWFMRWLLKPTYEVRLIKIGSGRNVVGQRIYQGPDYKKARKAATDRFALLTVRNDADYTIRVTGVMDIVDIEVVQNEPIQADILNDEAQAGLGQNHVCDTNGSLVLSEAGGYVPSCSICERPYGYSD